MNKLLNRIIEERKGHYCHCIEVSCTYDIENVIESIFGEYNDTFTVEEITEFLTSLDIIYCDDNEDCPANEDDENNVYTFDIGEYIKELI